MTLTDPWGIAAHLERLPDVNPETVNRTRIGPEWVFTSASTNVYGVRTWTTTVSDGIADRLRTCVAHHHPTEDAEMEHHLRTANRYRMLGRRAA